MDISPTLDGLIDRYAAMLREFAAFARGVREEHGTDEVGDDPRVEEFDRRLGRLGAELSDAFRTETGVHAPVTAFYEPGEAAETVDDDGDYDVEELRLEFVVRNLEDDSIGDWLLTTGEALAEELTHNGYEVLGWTNVRAPAFPVEDDEAADPDDDEP